MSTIIVISASHYCELKKENAALKAMCVKLAGALYEIEKPFEDIENLGDDPSDDELVEVYIKAMKARRDWVREALAEYRKEFPK